MKRKIKGLIMQIPAMILLIATLIGVFYVKIQNIMVNNKPIGWATPITVLIIVILYFWGLYLQSKEKDPFAI